MEKAIKKQSKGITLISLVITIIVLLILAAITISILTGENGVLSKASESKEVALRSEAKEELDLLVLGVQTEKLGAATLTDIVEALKKDSRYTYVVKLSPTAQLSDNGDIKTTSDVGQLLNGKSKIYVTHRGFEFEINGKMDVTFLNKVGDTNQRPTSSDYQSLVSQITEEDYGKSINYSTTVSGTTISNWQVFYNDGSNVYIILDDYLDASLVPSSTGVTTDTSNYKYKVWSNTDRDTLLNGLTTENYWSEFADGVTGATATGSPSAEMLIASYNEKYNSELNYTDDPTLDKSNTLYVLSANTEKGRVCGYWLTTPTTYNEDYSWIVNYDGHMWGDCYDGTYTGMQDGTGYGIRPVVMLPASLKGTVGDSIEIAQEQLELAINISASTTAWTNQNITLTGKSQDAENGLVAYAWTNSESTPTTWINISETKDLISATTIAETNGTKYFWTKNAIGNVKCLSYKVSKIDKIDPPFIFDSSYFIADTSDITVCIPKYDNNVTDEYASSGIKSYKLEYYVSGSSTANYVTANDCYFKINGLTPSTSYTLSKLTISDYAGNENEIELNYTLSTKKSAYGY